MAVPRYSQEEFWSRIIDLEGREIKSLTGRRSHRVVSIDNNRKRYRVAYSNSNNKPWVYLDKLYPVYERLYAHGILARSDSPWKGPPGGAALAILPQIDKAVQPQGGSLYVSETVTEPVNVEDGDLTNKQIDDLLQEGRLRIGMVATDTRLAAR
jgi:hypothetical protein